jgi:hypothetical protein
MKTIIPKAAHAAANQRIGFKTLHGKISSTPFLSVGCLLLTACLAAAEGKPDYSTPLAAAKSYFTAMKTGDAKGMDSASLGTRYQKEWMAMFMRSCVAYEKLDKASAEKFGREQTDKVFGELKQSCSVVTGTLDALTNCDVKIDGTNAAITFKPNPAGDTPDPLKLQQGGREWRLVLDPGIDKADFSAALMAAQGASTEKCAADIRAGKYKTAEEAQQAMMSAMMAQYMQSPEQRAMRGERSGDTNPAATPGEKPAAR